MSTKNILNVTGSYPPLKCGVGDYLKQLYSETSDQTDLYNDVDWSYSTIFKKFKKFKKYSLIHFQYPTMAYGWSLVPLVLTMLLRLTGSKTMVTLHELSDRTTKARWATIPFLWFANKIVFTTIHEQNSAKRYCFWIAKKSKIIPIGSNIPFVKEWKPFNERKYDVVYFGLIMPNKGIEEFLMVQKSLSDLNFAMVGLVMEQFEGSVELKQKAEKQGVLVILDKEAEEVSEILSNSKVAYLPFPDGLTLRRGSFQAALGNGVIICSTKGDKTDASLLDVFEDCPNENDVCERIKKLCISSDDEIKPILQKNKIFVDSNLLKWERIAKIHLDYYEKALL